MTAPARASRIAQVPRPAPAHRFADLRYPAAFLPAYFFDIG
ncbi:hypothetical protein BURMUCGD1_4018 [Burkholderia multivorans CGD1]|jgi:hypothetical protein|nr:hypothetical protein BURMUCGD1_4018 [Burkholderia multivorans CGD1]